MILSVRTGRNWKYYHLRKNREVITLEGRNLTFLKIHGHYVLRAPETVRISREEIVHGTVIPFPDSSGTILYFSEEGDCSPSFSHVRADHILTCGSSPEDDIRIEDSRIAAHCCLIDPHMHTVRDTENTDMASLNGITLQEAGFETGDVLRILSLTIVFGNGFLSVQENRSVQIRPEDYEPPLSRIPLEPAFPADHGFLPDEPELCPSVTISLREPPHIASDESRSFLIQTGPALTMSLGMLGTGMLSFHNSWMNGRSMMESAPALIYPLILFTSVLIWNPLRNHAEKKEKKRKMLTLSRRYAEYLNTQEDLLQKAMDLYRKNAQILYPPPSALAHGGAYLCRRTCWSFCFGWTSMPFEADITGRSFRFETDAMSEAYETFPKTDLTMTEIPAVLRAEEALHVTVLDHTAGHDLYRYLFLQAAAQLHDPDLRLMIVIRPQDAQDYDFLAFLRQSRQVSVLTPEQLRMPAEEKTDGRLLVLRIRPDAEDLVPENCMVIDLDGAVSHTDRMINAYEDGIRLKNRDGTVCSAFLPAEMRSDFSGALAALVPHGNQQYVRASDFFSAHQIEQLSVSGIREQWQRNHTYDHVSACIGITDTGEPVLFDLHEKGAGPHGLIAGSTGSGKSEFLISMILSLAYSYSPEELQFLILDFKGGGASGVFHQEGSELPHIAGVLTDLDAEDTDKALVSLRMECRRRETALKEMSERFHCSVNNADTCSRLLEGKMPHLIIIVDEAAELKAKQPDFFRDLISIARIGRSLGIHLILCTQKPAGIISDQIRSNCRFRIALKVQDRQDSLEVIGSPEAAYLSEPGDFILVSDRGRIKGKAAYASCAENGLLPDIALYDLFGNQHCRRENKVTETQVSLTVKKIREAADGLPQIIPVWLGKPELPLIRKEDRQSGVILLGIADDYWHRSHPRITLDQNSTHLLVLAPERTEKEHWLKGLRFSLKQCVRSTDRILYDPEDIRNLMKHTLTPDGRTYVLITDMNAFLDKPDARTLLERTLKNGPESGIRLILHIRSTADLRYRDFAYLPLRIALSGADKKELSEFFETSVRASFRKEGYALIRTEHLLEMRCVKEGEC